jgi:small subunit ribosomal protein S20
LAKLDNVEKKRMRNRSVRSYVKTVMAGAESAIEAGQAEAGREAVTKAVSALDKAAKKGVIHPNQAARRKSRLTRKLNQKVNSQG